MDESITLATTIQKRKFERGQAAFDRKLQRRRVEVSRRQTPVIEQAPLVSEPLD